jgi:hypothetical protein
MESAMSNTVTVEREEWDRIRAECTKLIDIHNMVRKLSAVILQPETATEEELLHAKVEMQHFLRDYG